MIDEEGFRENIGIILTNNQCKLLWAKRAGQNAWQFPQGGIQPGETLEEALYRELYEELGLLPEHVRILAVSRNWLRYRLPKRFIRYDLEPLCLGQKQKWFLLRLEADETHVCLDKHKPPEFDVWRWVSYWHPLKEVIAFKRSVYASVLKEFTKVLFKKNVKQKVECEV